MKLEAVSLSGSNSMKGLGQKVNVLVLLLSSSLLSCAGIKYRAYEAGDMHYIEQSYFSTPSLDFDKSALLIGRDFKEFEFVDISSYDPLLNSFFRFDYQANSIVNFDSLHDPLRFNLEFSIFE